MHKMCSMLQYVYMKKLLAMIDVLVVDKNMFGPYWVGNACGKVDT